MFRFSNLSPGYDSAVPPRAESVTTAAQRPWWGFALLWATIGVLVAYSLALLAIEANTSQENVRNYFTDIVSPVRFYAVNTTLSVFLLWATALLFGVCLAIYRAPTIWNQRLLFYASQVAIFAYLGFDDRFRVHEWLGQKLDTADHHYLLLVAVAEVACLYLLGHAHLRQGWARFYLACAAGCFVLTMAVDAAAPHDGFLRLSIEDLAKTWGTFFFFLFGWDQVRIAVDEVRRGTGPLTLGAPNQASQNHVTAPRSQPATAGRTGRVLVVADDSRIVLPIARSLGRRNLAVDVAWCPSDAAALRSRYIHGVHQLPFKGLSSGEQVAAVLELANRERYDLILPASDRAAFAFHQERQSWDESSRVCMLNAQAYDICCDKEKTRDFAESLGVAVPATASVDSREQLRVAVANLGGSAIIKPLQSISAASSAEKCFVCRVASVEEALAVAPDAGAAPWRLLVQEVVDGLGYGVEVLADHGQILSAFQHKRLHETIGHGSTLRESVPLDAELLESVEKLVRAMDYTGVGMFEFRFQPKTGRFVLLEINGRFWGSLELAVAAGADFPRYLYERAVEGQTHFPPGYQVGILSRDLYGDLRWMYRAGPGRRSTSQHRGESGWDTNPVSPFEWLQGVASLAAFGHRIDTFVWDDPQPAFYELDLLRSSIAARLWPTDAPTAGADGELHDALHIDPARNPGTATERRSLPAAPAARPLDGYSP